MWYVILLAVCIGGDQLLKWWVTSHLDVGQSAPLLPGIVRLTGGPTPARTTPALPGAASPARPAFWPPSPSS